MKGSSLFATVTRKSAPKARLQKRFSGLKKAEAAQQMSRGRGCEVWWRLCAWRLGFCPFRFKLCVPNISRILRVTSRSRETQKLEMFRWRAQNEEETREKSTK
jgi:hypothetical protein